MSEAAVAAGPEKRSRFTLPSAYTILLALVVGYYRYSVVTGEMLRGGVSRPGCNTRRLREARVWTAA
jgi:hypothetical protein